MIVMGSFYFMRRHVTLIPFSKQHHQMLVLAQVLKTDVPDYIGMPTTVEGKHQFLLEKFEEVILPNLNKHRNLFYPAILQWGFTDQDLLQRIQEKEDDVVLICKEIKDGNILNNTQLNELGYALDTLVRMKERELYEKVQARYSLELEELKFQFSWVNS